MNYIGSQGWGVVTNTGGRDRLRNIHATEIILFEMKWLSIGLFQH